MLQCHCRQSKPTHKTASHFTRILDPQRCGKANYTRSTPPPCTHWGQLKLLLSEIEFLTPFYGQSFRVVYAGAAPGVHIPLLASMFATMRFVLVDPQPSMIENREYPNIVVLRDFMSDALAEEFAGSPVLFISDVRVGAGEKESDDAQQDRIQRDMDAQRRWIELMHPVASMLKFRLPWRRGVTNYLSGTIFFPVYGKALTHEARLVVPGGACAVDYDNGLYEQQMVYFNRRLRPAIQSVLGGGCYDCTSFRWIVRGYLARTLGNSFDPLVVDAHCIAIELELRACVTAWALRRNNAVNSSRCI
jgi:hypothetical protein